MSGKKLAFALTVLSLVTILPWSGCKEAEDPTSPSTTVHLEKAGNLQLSFNKSTSINSDVEDIDTVTAILTRSGYESVLINLAIGSGIATGTMFDVSEGIWHLTINAKDTSGTVIYRGNTDVEIINDQTTFVSIELMPASTSGNLSINVSWEEGDGINWTEYFNNPVLDLGSNGEWDDYFICYPCIIYNGNKYEMWYTGYDGNTHRIGYASSTDGINWNKYSGNPILNVGENEEWDDYHVTSPTVIYNGNNYEMWYSGNNSENNRIGYATSTDGINWNKYSGNPVLNIGDNGEWDDSHACQTTVIYNDGYYQMWYVGNDSLNYKVGYATSSNGIDWIKYSGNPVLEVGTSGSCDIHTITPSVIFDGSNYKMWYAGYQDGTGWQICNATSADGINWTKYSNNPIISIGTTNSWNDSGVFGPCVLYNGLSYKMWFCGNDGTNYRIGYATSP